MVQTDLFKAEHLVMGFVVLRGLLELVDKVLHFILAYWLYNILFLLVRFVAVIVLRRLITARKVEILGVEA